MKMSEIKEGHIYLTKGGKIRLVTDITGGWDSYTECTIRFVDVIPMIILPLKEGHEINLKSFADYAKKDLGVLEPNLKLVKTLDLGKLNEETLYILQGLIEKAKHKKWS